MDKFLLETVRITLQPYVSRFSVDRQDVWEFGDHERFLQQVSHFRYAISISPREFECDNPSWDCQSPYLDSQFDRQAWKGMKCDLWGLKSVHDARVRNQNNLIDKTTRGEVYQFPNRFSNDKSAGPKLYTLTTIIEAERRALTSNYPRRFLVISYDY